MADDILDPNKYSLKPVDDDPFNLGLEQIFTPSQTVQDFWRKGVAGLPSLWAGRAWQAATTPHDVMSGELEVGSAEYYNRANSLAGAAMTGVMPFAQRGAAGIFGGRLAQGLGRDDRIADLEQARRFERAGYAPNAVWSMTGWARGADGGWRFEIPDTFSRIRSVREGKITEGRQWYMQDLLHHPELYEKYPFTANLPVKSEELGDLWAVYRPVEKEVVYGTGTILRDDPMFHKVTLHELQHAVQEHERFAPGANPTGMGELAAAVARANPKINPVEAREAGNRLGRPLYMNLAGEVEARNVMSRFDMLDEKLLQRSPADTEDTARNVQIILDRRTGRFRRANAVDYDPFGFNRTMFGTKPPQAARLVPVDHDPFAAAP